MLAKSMMGDIQKNYIANNLKKSILHQKHAYLNNMLTFMHLLAKVAKFKKSVKFLSKSAMEPEQRRFVKPSLASENQRKEKGPKIGVPLGLSIWGF